MLVALLQRAVSREKKGYKTVHNLHMNSRIGHECKCEKCEMTGCGDGMHSAALTATTTAIYGISARVQTPLPSEKIGEEPLLRFFPRGGGGSVRQLKEYLLSFTHEVYTLAKFCTN